MRRLSLFVVAVLMTTVLGACGTDGVEVTAAFSDIGDLATGAPVTMADIQIGEVKDIDLAGKEAVVTLTLDPDARVPDGVTARVRRTSVLGERIVDIVLPENVSDASPLLEDGDHIDQTVVRTDLEDLVEEGADVFGAITASQLAIMIEEGAKGFGGKGQELANLLKNYRDIIHAYAGRSKQIVSLIGSLRRFNETLASRSDEHARSVVNSARAINVLEEESLRLEQAVISLGRLARGSRAILTAHSDEMHRFFQQSRVILGVLAERQKDLSKFLYWAPGHNYNTQAVEYLQFNQIIQDFVFCGLNDNPKDPARRCKEAGS